MNIYYHVLVIHRPSISVDKSVNILCISIMECFLQIYRIYKYYSFGVLLDYSFYLNIKAYIDCLKNKQLSFAELWFLRFGFEPHCFEPSS